MVIGPKALIDRIKEKESTAVRSLEENIDRTLESKFNGSPIAVGYDHELRSFVLEGVLDKYRATGWSVRIVYDQRDGNYIEFSYRESR
jgi:hypothetical protein